MSAVEQLAAPPEDALAARRSLRAQIARLERELAAVLVSAYPTIALAAREEERARSVGARPRLLDLAELERARDKLAARLTTVQRRAADQAGRQAAARARLHAMLADPPAHKGATLGNADLGLPGCTCYRVVPRLGPVGLLTGWWRVKISSGCPLPSRRP
jgi:hypothetical protein